MKRKTDISDVEAKSLTTDRLEDVLDGGILDEGYVDDLNVRKVGHELEPNSHEAAESDVFEEDRQSSGCQRLADTNGQDDLGVNLLCNLLLG